jgi:hypothetical protein
MQAEALPGWGFCLHSFSGPIMPREGKSQLRKRKTLIKKVNYKYCKKLYEYYKIFMSG